MFKATSKFARHSIATPAIGVMLIASTGMVMSSIAQAAVQGRTFEYTAGGETFQGYLAYDDAAKKPSAAVLIVHDWMGLSDGSLAQRRANDLAKQGYVAFAADVYGKGQRPKDAGEAAKMAGALKENRTKLRNHIRAAFDALANMKNVDAKKIVGMGYCFGGTTVLELARSGAPVAATASFHGGLSTPNTQDAQNIKTPVLAMHGADDPFVPAAEVAAFKEEMSQAHVKLDFVAYPGAVHSFTEKNAGNDNSKGAAYNAEADKKSWSKFQSFLKKVL